MSSPTLLSRIVRRILLALYRWKGWRITSAGTIPAKCVIVGAPHTSNWDFVFFIGVTEELGLRPRYMGKASLFRWPLRRFMFDMGGIAVERSKRANYVEQVIAEYAKSGELALVVAPEGTRGAIDEWRSGFYHIALGASVPILPAWVDHARMIGGIGPAIMPTGDFVADLCTIAKFYQSVMPDHPKLAILYAQAGLAGAPAPFAA